MLKSVSIAFLLAVLAPPETSGVVFSAGLTKPVVVTKGQRVVFDRAWYNLDNSYDTNTGIFTVPKTGVYEVKVNAMSDMSRGLLLQVLVDGKYYVSLFANGGRMACSNSFITSLSQGMKVSVESLGSSTLYGASTGVFSSFSVSEIENTEMTTGVETGGSKRASRTVATRSSCPFWVQWVPVPVRKTLPGYENC